MKKKYYVNRQEQDNGDHEVHEEACEKLPELKNLLPLGEFYTCHAAIAEAKRYFLKVDGCYYCSVTVM